MKEIQVALCGMGGYGETYAEALLNQAEEYGCRLVAGIDPYPERSAHHGLFAQKRIPVYPTLESFFEREKCDLTIVSTPIQFHCGQTCLALRHGSHVLCEKPVTASMEEADAMIEAERVSGLSVTVGFQRSFNPALQQFKSDCLAGRFGRPLLFRAIACSPRSESYFQRNSWAGAICDPNGRLVLDSPASNGHAHSLHNLLYIAGPARELSLHPTHIEAELFRANAISNYDTAAMRIHSADGPTILFHTSHAVRERVIVECRMEFERAVATHDWVVDDCLRATLADGTVIEYGPTNTEPLNKLRQAVAAARHEGAPACGITAAREHTRCIALAQATESGILPFDSSRIREIPYEQSRIIYAERLDEEFQECYEQGLLPGEAKFDWRHGKKS